MLEDRDQIVRDIKKSVEGLASIPDFVYGMISKSVEHAELKRIVIMANSFKSLPFDNLLDVDVSSLRDYASQSLPFATRMNNIAQSQFPSSVAANFAASWADDFNSVQAFMQYLATVAPYLVICDPNVGTVRRYAEEAVGKETHRLEGLSAEVGRFVVEGNATLKDLKNGLMAAEEHKREILGMQALLGAQRNNTYFAVESENHRKASVKWLAAAAILMGLGVLAAFLFVWRLPITAKWTEPGTVESLVARLLTVGALISGAAWSASIYRARAHLAVINSHRAVAVQTLELFVANVDDETIRDGIVGAAAHLVYSDATTGLIGGNPDFANKLVDKLLDGATSKLK